MDSLANREQTNDVARWLKDRGASATAQESEDNTLLNYKVYLPPVASAAEADVQIESMQRNGIADIIRISRGDLKNGIALGVYSTEDGVARRINELNQKGFAAQSAPRYQTRKVFWLNVSAPDPEAVDPRAFSSAFPGHDITSTPCP